MRSTLWLLAYSMSVLACSASNTAGEISFTGTELRPMQVIVDRVLSKYLNDPRPTDSIAKKYPHLFDVKVKDLTQIDHCDGWIVKAWVPTSEHPPYYEDNHHYEYWGVSTTTDHFLGRGEDFALDQEIDVRQFAAFINNTCGRSLEVNVLASIYVRLTLAGRMPFASAESNEPRMWHWVERADELPTGWVDEILKASAIPPEEFRGDRDTVFRGCIRSQVGVEHSDIACWSFRFDESLRLHGVDQTYRRQTVPGFPTDLGQPSGLLHENK